MGTLSLRQVTSYKPIHLCNVEELAAEQIVRPSGGMLFARNPDREAKDAARNLILDLFSKSAWPNHLRVLTMPGVDWRFERKLLGRREGNWMHGLAAPRQTTITSVENDRYIYYMAAAKMPGLNTKRALTRYDRPASFAERTIRNKFIQAFHFANVDDLMRETASCWDVVWLDYTGPLSTERLKLIADFYERSVHQVLIVTSLKARWNKETSLAIAKCGGHSNWLRQHLVGEVLHDIEYFDTSPMAQFAIRRAAS